MKVRDITSVIEAYAPLSLQEDFDNSGLNVGNPESEVSGILLCVDVTEAVVSAGVLQAGPAEGDVRPVVAHGLDLFGQIGGVPRRADLPVPEGKSDELLGHGDLRV